MEEKQLLNWAKHLLATGHSLIGGCNCNHCRGKWEDIVTEPILKMIYPKIPFIPPTVEYYLEQHDPYSAIDLIARIKERNAAFSKEKKGKKKAVRLYYCRYCGDLTDSPSKVHGKYLCSGCADQVGFCEICDSFAHVDRLYSTHDDEQVCNTCIRAHGYTRCHRCDRYALPDNIIRISLNFEEQVSFCTHCLEGLDDCQRCGEGKVHPDFSYRDADNYLICSACNEEDQGMMPYYYKPSRFHFKKSPFEGKVSEKAFYMGCEIEIARMRSQMDQHTMVHLIKEKFGKDRFYGMHDGTIERATGYQGLEIVSHPFTWQDYKNNLAIWDEVLLFIRSKGWRSNLKGVGFHIHTTKAAWGTYQIYRLMKFIYENQKFVTLIAGRKPTEYCRMRDGDYKDIAKVCREKKNRNRDHYSAVNLNTSQGAASKTIEFRMFQGTLEPLIFHKNVEFTKACYDFTKKYGAPTLEDYLWFVKKNRRSYPCLNEYLRLKGAL